MSLSRLNIYDADQYQKSQDYLRVNTRFGWISAIFNLIVLLSFWFLGGFQVMDNWVRSFEMGPIPTGLIYMGALMLL